MKKVFFSAILSVLILSACSSSDEFVKNEIEIDLSETIINSDSDKLSVKSPNNWSSVNDNIEQLFDIWLVSPNNKAVIGFIPLSIDKNSKIDSDEGAIKLLSTISLESKKSNNADFLNETENQIKETDKYLFTQLFYEIDDKKINSIIFGKNSTYYECLAYFSKSYEPTDDEYEALLKLQSIVISSSTLK